MDPIRSVATGQPPTHRSIGAMPEIETIECGDPEDAMRIESQIANKGKHRAFSHVVAPPGHPRQISDRDVTVTGMRERSKLCAATTHRLQATPDQLESR
jgi:hypothetical protein